MKHVARLPLNILYFLTSEFYSDVEDHFKYECNKCINSII